MNWFKEHSGWLTACLISALLGAVFVLWVKKKPDTPSGVVIDAPKPVQPVWDTVYVPKLAIDTLTFERPVPMPTKIESLRVVQEKTAPCPPFTLHLVSSDSVPANFGLDSVSVFYRWPLGDHYFAYWGRPSSNTSRQVRPTSNFLSLGMNMTIPLSDFPRTSFLAYLSFPTLPKEVDLQVGWRQAQKSGWFVGVRREFVIF